MRTRTVTSYAAVDAATDATFADDGPLKSLAAIWTTCRHVGSRLYFLVYACFLRQIRSRQLCYSLFGRGSA
jgi:hypothetical protein